ncbi:myosin-G heavy chain isoform X2 [Scaptodrosophila lebanonensis]|uniref:Myosin-G heavy chain isoform X2 n=1 Tax=Drosophila lebanonensis TaxID=7225 RepID=A0A6J2UD15_DROLE|nr:myosin-G heavy chain isoform X2 [Scaptodrosophila lebanonensis]
MCFCDGKIAYYDLDEEEQPEAIVVDFSRNKSLVEDNAKLMNKSIINITLQEAKELIRKAKTKRETHVPPLNLEELNDELESSIADAVSSLGRSGDASKSTCVEQPNSSKPKSRKPRFKPKITINNCNGTINLRNIASLTINCANEEAVSAEIPLTQSKLEQSADSSTTDHSTPTTTASSSNYSSNASSRSQSKKQKSNNNNSSIGKKDYQKGAVATSSTSVESTPTNTQPTSTNSYSNRYEEDVEVSETETHDVTCDFYNRLLNEIKKSLKEKPIRSYDNAPVATTNLTTTNASNKATTNSVQAAAADSTCDANSNSMRRSNDGSAPHTNKTHTNVTNSTLSSNIQPGKRLVLKNFENLKIILEANSGDEDTFHPVQIEQWLAEIISETDLEPMQNTDILEHSKINNSETN